MISLPRSYDDSKHSSHNEIPTTPFYSLCTWYDQYAGMNHGDYVHVPRAIYSSASSTRAFEYKVHSMYLVLLSNTLPGTVFTDDSSLAFSHSIPTTTKTTTKTTYLA